MIPDRKFISANYMLINDNLLDLSHVAFVHKDSFGKGDEEANKAFARSTVSTTKLPNGIRVERFSPGNPAPAYIRELLNEPALDYHTWYEFLVPGYFLLQSRSYAPGTFDRVGKNLENEPVVFAEYSCQAVTPITKDTVCYYFALGPWSRHSQFKEAYHQLGHQAFDEDRDMIEAQQQVINRSEGHKMMNLIMDQAPVAFRAMMDGLMAAERDEAQAA